MTKLYGSQKALDAISFEAREGEIVGLLGPNGAGKTTCMKIISCFTPSSSGEVSVFGMSPESDSLGIRKLLGYLPEHNPLYGSMYVREYLSFIAQVHKIENPKARIEELIELTGLSGEKHKQISSLSKGYKQRVGIAQAIIHDPKLIILDEPISGLDPNQLIEIRSLIESLREGRIIIFSSHILQEVESICDRVVILDRGTIVADNDVKQIKESHRKEKNVVVEFKSDVDESSLKAIDTELRFERINSKKFIIHAYSEGGIQEKLFDMAVSSGNKILELSASTDSLEDIFKSLTGDK